MSSDPQSVDAVGDLRVLARLLNSRTEIGVSECNAVFVAARCIDNLPSRDSTVRVDPVATTTTERGGRIGDLLAVAVSRCGRELSHCELKRFLRRLLFGGPHLRPSRSLSGSNLLPSGG